MKTVVTGRNKIEAEMKAEHLADKGWQMIGAPYFCHHYERWEHEVKKPANQEEPK